MYEYLNNTVWAKLGPSPIHGVGVFAIRDIPLGTKITDHGLSAPNFEIITLTEDEFEKVHPAIQNLLLDRMSFQSGQPLATCSPNVDAFLQSFMNHSNE